ncbi:MAG: dihydropteroate synthase [Chlamydiota bacterium]|nr:dihydropteroate synthase [Chlamydiota bacterium]
MDHALSYINKNGASKSLLWDVKDRVIEFSGRMQIMGIVNVTPDSFYDGGKYFKVSDAIRQALTLVEQGADMIDIGGQSSRPYSEEIPIALERERVIPVIQALSREVDVPISVDTYRFEVARDAVDAGAHMINDISALRIDSRLAMLAKDSGAGLILMHMRGLPRNMQEDTEYVDLMAEISGHLRSQMNVALEAGVREEQIIVDPGIGFGKNTEQNLRIMAQAGFFKKLMRPIVLGPSRKSFIGDVIQKGPEQRLSGTLACIARAYYDRVPLVRVHDVEAVADFLKLLNAIEQER